LAEALAADEEDLEALEAIAKQIPHAESSNE